MAGLSPFAQRNQRNRNNFYLGEQGQPAPKRPLSQPGPTMADAHAELDKKPGASSKYTIDQQMRHAQNQLDAEAKGPGLKRDISGTERRIYSTPEQKADRARKNRAAATVNRAMYGSDTAAPQTEAPKDEGKKGKKGKKGKRGKNGKGTTTASPAAPSQKPPVKLTGSDKFIKATKEVTKDVAKNTFKTLPLVSTAAKAIETWDRSPEQTKSDVRDLRAFTPNVNEFLLGPSDNAALELAKKTTLRPAAEAGAQFGREMKYVSGANSASDAAKRFMNTVVAGQDIPQYRPLGLPPELTPPILRNWQDRRTDKMTNQAMQDNMMMTQPAPARPLSRDTRALPFSDQGMTDGEVGMTQSAERTPYARDPNKLTFDTPQKGLNRTSAAYLGQYGNTPVFRDTGDFGEASFSDAAGLGKKQDPFTALNGEQFAKDYGLQRGDLAGARRAGLGRGPDAQSSFGDLNNMDTQTLGAVSNNFYTAAQKMMRGNGNSLTQPEQQVLQYLNQQGLIPDPRYLTPDHVSQVQTALSGFSNTRGAYETQVANEQKTAAADTTGAATQDYGADRIVKGLDKDQNPMKDRRTQSVNLAADRLEAATNSSLDKATKATLGNKIASIENSTSTILDKMRSGGGPMAYVAGLWNSEQAVGGLDAFDQARNTLAKLDELKAGGRMEFGNGRAISYDEVPKDVLRLVDQLRSDLNLFQQYGI